MALENKSFGSECNLIKKLLNYMLDLRDRQQIAIAVGKGAAMMQGRRIDLTRPATWEFSAFSQNGEDGILDVLRKQLIDSNRYFVEIGSADGLQNNSSWLVVAEQYAGLMVEGNPSLVGRARRLIPYYSLGAECVNMFVDSSTVKLLKKLALHPDPDVFSLDIDGVDYYVAEAIFDAGFRPKIFVVEYNSVFGPERSITVPYKENFSFGVEHSTRLYYGVSVSAWRKLFAKQGYRFVTVDSKGVNAFFVDPSSFDPSFLDFVVGVPFNENLYQLRKFRGAFEAQFKLIEDQRFVDV
jgi:hypothetical protein